MRRTGRQTSTTARQALAAAALACLLSLAVLPGVAGAGSYTVLACDAASEGNFIAHGWQASSSRGETYVRCPTNNDSLRGISNRIVGSALPAPRDTYSVFQFSAPPGDTLSSIWWGGRAARGSCDWTTALISQPGGFLVNGLTANSRCTTTGFDLRHQPASYPLAPGTTTIAQAIQCKAASQCTQGATFHTNWAVVTVNDPQDPAIRIGGPLADGKWVSGDQSVNFEASDNTGISQVYAELARTRKGELFYPCSSVNARRCPTTPVRNALDVGTATATDGANLLRVVAVDASGNTEGAERTVRVDNTPPDAVRPTVIGGDGWRRENRFDLRWANPPGQAAPIARVHWELCPPRGPCEKYDREGAATGIDGLSTSAAGNTALRIWLQDDAGNQRRPPDYDVVHLRHDPVPPSLGFEPQNPLDPLRVAVDVRDEHSGLNRGEIEMRRVGGDTWHALKTVTEGSQLVANVDDERFRSGAYEFRARGVDNAGNESSTGRRLDGSAASLRLPVRIATRMRVGFRRTVRRRRVVGRQRRVVRRRVVVLQPAARVKFRRRVRLRGRIVNPDGQPLDGATIQVATESGRGQGFVPVGLAHANALGRFSYVARALRSRILRFQYLGSRQIRSVTRDVRLEVPAESTIRASRRELLNGETVTFRGRIRTRPLPATGKLVEIQAFFRGRWRTISTVRASRGGAWQFPYQFGGTVGTVRYRFRALLPPEGGYPFGLGSSKPVQVIVHGL